MLMGMLPVFIIIIMALIYTMSIIKIITGGSQTGEEI